MQDNGICELVFSFEALIIAKALESTKEKYKQLCFVICVGVVIVCNIKFSYLINALYPVFGFLGLLQVIYFWLISFVNKTIEKNGKN